MGRTRFCLSIMVAMIVVLAAGFLLPERLLIPVAGATPADWHHETFWYEPWGASGVHKGIDIFAPEGRPVIAASPGLVVFVGDFGRGGRSVAVLGPKWRLHYYAHLSRADVAFGALVVPTAPRPSPRPTKAPSVTSARERWA